MYLLYGMQRWAIQCCGAGPFLCDSGSSQLVKNYIPGFEPLNHKTTAAAALVRRPRPLGYCCGEELDEKLYIKPVDRHPFRYGDGGVGEGGAPLPLANTNKHQTKNIMYLLYTEMGNPMLWSRYLFMRLRLQPACQKFRLRVRLQL
jgi:hypothetical protein